MTNQVPIKVALLERAVKVLGYTAGEDAQADVRAELAALIPTDPMAEAREVLVKVTAALGFTHNSIRGFDAAVEVIHTALNAPRPMTPEVEAAFDTLSPLHVYANYSLALDILTAQFQPALKHGGGED